jgi:N-acetylglucosaminyldiphosphoundecaprenol N-acetyl-beta-D-mannosaminyltransferase
LDGKPLLWLARLLGYPMTETVAGSTLIQELHQDKSATSKLSIFLFGGEGDAAERAAKEINKDPGGLYAVGSLNPGFGTVEELSSDAIINAINQTEPDILLVSLGAKKGAQWIEQNRSRLKAKIISHLGATIYFLAGTVQRAPKAVSSMGLEWIWRILQEPKLFSRYAVDGLILLRVLISRFWLWRQFLSKQRSFKHNDGESTVTQHENDGEIVLSFGRNLQLTPASPLRKLFSTCALSKKDIRLDFKQTEFASGAFLALLLLLSKCQQKANDRIECVNVNDNLIKLFTLFCIQKNIRIR